MIFHAFKKNRRGFPLLLAQGLQELLPILERFPED